MPFKPIGIIGGAGPLAGVLMLERLFQIAQKEYGCHADADFPQVTLLSFPFSDMLSDNMDVLKIKWELSSCLQQLRKSGARVLSIACNTLHVFLDENDPLNDLVHLPKEIAKELGDEIPIVLCTSTSMKSKVHKRFFPCLYPDLEDQKKVDLAIDWILKGSQEERVLEILADVFDRLDSPSVVLGCTELSLIKTPLLRFGKKILDPLEIAAIKILKKSSE
jgi:aspartate racemase